MAFTLFASIQSCVQSLCLGAKQRLRHWTRPDNSNDSLAVGTAWDLSRSKDGLGANERELSPTKQESAQ
jgi:hypothetical protein